MDPLELNSEEALGMFDALLERKKDKRDRLFTMLQKEVTEGKLKGRLMGKGYGKGGIRIYVFDEETAKLIPSEFEGEPVVAIVTGEIVAC